MGLNISKACEHALKVYIAIKQADQEFINKTAREISEL